MKTPHLSSADLVSATAVSSTRPRLRTLAPPQVSRVATDSRVMTVALAALTGSAWLVLVWALVGQHRAFNSRAYDLGYFDQVIWNTAHGRWFETNFVQFNFLGEHFQPVLLLFAALYRVLPSVEALLVIQATVVAAAAIPLYIATRRLLSSSGAALMVAAAYLLAPQLHAAVLFDFHPELLGIASIFFALMLVTQGRPLGSVAALSTVFLLKEDAVMVGAGFAWVLWLCGYRRPALLLLVLCLIYAAAVMGVIMPALRDDSDGLLARYGYLGHGPVGMLSGAMRNPSLLWEHLSGFDQRRAVAMLTSSQALLPLCSPAGPIVAPMLAVNLLSTHTAQHSLALHYGAYPLALSMVASVFGIAWLSRWRPLDRAWRRLHVPPAGRALLLASALLLAEVAAWATVSPLGGRFDERSYQRTQHAAAIERVMAQIPPDAPLSAQSNLVPHLSQRRFVRDFPRVDHAAYVVIDLQSWGIWQTTYEIYVEVLWGLPEVGFCRIVEDDGVELYARPCPTP